MHNFSSHPDARIRALNIDISTPSLRPIMLQPKHLNHSQILSSPFRACFIGRAVYRLLTAYEQHLFRAYMLILNHLPTQNRENTISSRSSL